MFGKVADCVTFLYRVNVEAHNEDKTEKSNLSKIHAIYLILFSLHFNNINRIIKYLY